VTTHKRELQEDHQVNASYRYAWIRRATCACVVVAMLTGGLIAGLLQGCAGPAYPPRLVCENCRMVCGECEGQDRFVRLQGPSPGLRQDRVPNFSHPFTLSSEEWKIILSSLRVRRQGDPVVFFSLPKGPVSEALTHEEVDYLSRTLSQAFAQAQPTEWVVFGLSRPGAPDVSEITTGGWFMEGSHLHLLLANYRYAVTAPNMRELVWENPLSSQVNVYELSPGDHQTMIQAKEGGLRRATGSEIAIAYQPLLLAEPLSTAALPDGSSASRLPQAQTNQLSMEERLKVLKRLRDQGLITEEEYRSKRSQLLERL
jgi:Short C-terminal domain